LAHNDDDDDDDDDDCGGTAEVTAEVSDFERLAVDWAEFGRGGVWRVQQVGDGH
jgi:hypothetical protein